MAASNIKTLDSDAGFKVLFECATIGILVISDTGRIELANPCATGLFGYQMGELIGKPVEVLVPDSLKPKHVGHRQGYFAAPKARPMGVGRELFARKKDGSVFPVEISLGHYKLDSENLAVAFVTDITEQARSRKIMAEREAWFRNIAENSPVMIWMSGTDKSCYYFNPSWLEFTGRTMDQEKGYGWADGVHPDDLQRCLKVYNDAFDARKSFTMEYRLRRHDGTYRWISDNGKPVHLPDGTFTGFIGSCADIHERYTINKDLEERVRQRTLELNQALGREKELNELKSRFVSIASHEFRTPLSALLSSAGLAQQYIERNEKEKTLRHIERIKSSVKNLNDILNDFLSLDKLEQGLVHISNTEFSLRDFARDIIEELSSLLKSGQEITLRFEGKEEIHQDQHVLRNVLINLLSNASKYSREGVIKLELEHNGDLVVIRVTDKGIGIPEHQQKHIFNRFFRADNTSNIQGTGLGLNIVNRYVELMNGRIYFESEAGKGTVFTVEIPANAK